MRKIHEYVSELSAGTLRIKGDAYHSEVKSHPFSSEDELYGVS